MPSFTLGEIAERLGCLLTGNAALDIQGVATLENAGPRELSFLTNPKYASKAKQTRAAAIIAAELLKDTGAATLVSSNPYLDFARALALFYQAPSHLQAYIPLP